VTVSSARAVLASSRPAGVPRRPALAQHTQPTMPTKLRKPIKREIEIEGESYTVTLSPEGVKLTRKGFRKGDAVSWKSLQAAARREGAQS
jgi:hypothetical protein